MGDDVQATLDSSERDLSTDAASIASTSLVDRTQAAETVVAGSTAVAQILNVNRQLHATLAAGSTPTAPVVQGQANTGDMSAAEDSREIVLTGVTASVHPDTGCVVGARTDFTSPVEQLYVTMQSFNVQAGTLLYVEWFYEGTIRVRQSWSVDITSVERCLWFEIDATDTTFTSGEWSVLIYVGEQHMQVSEPITFYITGGQ